VLTGSEVTAVLDRQTAVMEQVASGASLPDVLDSIVLALEELMPGSRCSILLLDGGGTLRHGSAPTLPAEYSAAIDGLVPGPSAGSCGTAVHLGAPVIAADVATDPRWERYRELAARHGLRACWSSPIRSGPQVVGTFAVYRGEPYEPDERDRELVRRFTHLTSLAVEHDRGATEREARHAAELARQGAERANHAKSQFVTALSHELRTPLQSITSFTENLQTLDLSPEQRRGALERISTAASHILSIVDDVLDLARVEAGAMPIELRDVDVHREIAGSVDLIEPLAAQRGIEIDFHGSPARVWADRRRLRQVILNLLSNAVRFSQPSSTIRVDTEVGGAPKVGHEGGTVQVHIVDQGAGIPEDLLARLFVPFDRLGAEAGREGGAGLGLVLARRLTEAMGGTLEVRSAVGLGTHAVVTLTAWGSSLAEGDGTLTERERDVAQREEGSARDRERAADERDRAADERDRAADDRERVADEREAAADQREGHLDHREKLGDERVVHLDQMAGRLGAATPSRFDRSFQALEQSKEHLRRSQERIGRSWAAVERSEAVVTRDRNRAEKDQDTIDREVSRSERDSAADPTSDAADEADR
jgi:signal transduction histidine kinase